MGPECYESHGHPVLTNAKAAYRAKTFCQELWNAHEIATITDKPVIACASAVPETCVTPAGASTVGIGSALIGMTTNQIADYFRTLTCIWRRI